MDTNIAEDILKRNNDFEGSKGLVDVPGMSSYRVCNFLNQLVARMDPDETYLEVGTWKGLTLLSAAHGNHGKRCVGCDKFRLWGKYSGFGPYIRLAFNRNLRRYRRHSATIHFHAMSYHDLFDRRLVPAPVGVYFYDGNHSAEDTRAGILESIPFLNQRAILVVDDWNGPTVREGTTAALAEGALTVLWERHFDGDGTVDGWWNGLAVFYLERQAVNGERA
ncbi:MAG: class I SAM-dependent methyltransferase [Gemmatimonadota bacterium]